MGLKIRIEPTIDHERRAKKALQVALFQTAGYGLPPIPCADRAAYRSYCGGCRSTVIWATGQNDRCSECKKQGNTGFQAAEIPS